MAKEARFRNISAVGQNHWLLLATKGQLLRAVYVLWLELQRQARR